MELTCIYNAEYLSKWAIVLYSQLHDRFEMLKRTHQEEKRNLEEKRRDLEEEMNTFNRRKVAAETLQSLQGSSGLKKDKEKKI